MFEEPQLGCISSGKTPHIPRDVGQCQKLCIRWAKRDRTLKRRYNEMAVLDRGLSCWRHVVLMGVSLMFTYMLNVFICTFVVKNKEMCMCVRLSYTGGRFTPSSPYTTYLVVVKIHVLKFVKRLDRTN